MREIQSKLIKKIMETDFNNRFFKPIVVKGLDYYKSGKVKEIYSPRYEELIGVVSGTIDYYVHLSLDKNAIHYSCSCPYQYNCKHIVAMMNKVKDNYEKFDDEAKVIEPVRGNSNPRLDEIVSFLYRLVGENFVISEYVEGEFNIYYNRLIRFLKEIIKSDEDKYQAGKFISDVLLFSVVVSYHNSTYQIKLDRDIFPLIKEVCLLTEDNEYHIIDGILDNISNKNINVLIEALKDYSKTGAITYAYNKLLNGAFGFASINQTVDLNNLIILKAKSLYKLDKDAFIKYANTYSYVEEIRLLLLQILFEEGKYSECISLYEKYDIYFNVNNYRYYLESLIKKGYDYNTSVIESFANNPTYELFAIIKDLGLLNDENLKNKIKEIASSEIDFSGKAKIISEIGDIKELYKLIVSMVNPKDRIEAIHDNIKSLMGINDLELIKIMEDDIVSILDRTDSFKSITKYLDDFYNFKLGNMYLYNLLTYIGFENKVSIYDSMLLQRYLSKASEVSHV